MRALRGALVGRCFMEDVDYEARLSGQLSLRKQKGGVVQARGMAETKSVKGGQCQACQRILSGKNR